MKPLILLELNEISFDYVRAYNARGELPAFAKLIAQHGLMETSSEDRYESVEPWIQWVSAHTGLSYQEHGVFRLGDFTRSSVRQIWEQLEADGLKVGAVSPMNAVNRLTHPAFFLPDPWTDTPASGPPLLRGLNRAIAQAVNDNAQKRITFSTAFALIAGCIRYAYPRHYAEYLHCIITAHANPWRRVILFERLLADAFEHIWRQAKPDFASLFLNGGAHIQHHYMFSSMVYEGSQRNPSWYIPSNKDPLLEIYQLYDRIVARYAQLGARLMVATGLHQIPYPKVTYYWRLKRHAQTLLRLGVRYASVSPRMSRDFLATFDDDQSCSLAAERLSLAIAPDGSPIFELDKRARELFVTLTYPGEISADFEIRIGNEVFERFNEEVTLVALKNGHHNGIGYFFDTGLSREQATARFPLTELPLRIRKALSLS